MNRVIDNEQSARIQIGSMEYFQLLRTATSMLHKDKLNGPCSVGLLSLDGSIIVFKNSTEKTMKGIDIK